MPDLDRTTLLKESFREMLERILIEVQDGEVSAGAAYDMLEAALPPAPSEAPAEAFMLTGQDIRVAQRETYQGQLDSDAHFERMAAWLNRLRLVRERQTGKG